MAMPAVSDRSSLLADEQLRAALLRYLRPRVPDSEVEDIAQAALADALASDRTPSEPTELRRWVYTIARNKVVDYYRRSGREVPAEPELADEIAAAESAPLSARELLRWAESELPDGEGSQSTLDWMLREGSGEKLEQIATDEQVPAPRVRQRVSRMRRFFRERWAQQMAAVAGVVLLVLAVVAVWKLRQPEEHIVHEPVVSPDQRAAELRREALEHCEAERWQRCVDGLDAAKRLDPSGEQRPAVQAAREAAARALQPAPETAPEPKAPAPEPAPAPETNAPETKAPAPLPKTDPKQERPFEAPNQAPIEKQPIQQKQAPVEQQPAPQQQAPVEQQQQAPRKMQGKPYPQNPFKK